MRARFSQWDILMELVELTRELTNDIRQQLIYYRASVYKHEARDLVEAKIKQLRFLVELTNHEILLEPLHDYDAIVQNGTLPIVPGECRLTAQVTHLLDHMDANMQEISEVGSPESLAGSTDLVRVIQQHKKEILGFCRYGSQHWNFFHSISPGHNQNIR